MAPKDALAAACAAAAELDSTICVAHRELDIAHVSRCADLNTRIKSLIARASRAASEADLMRLSARWLRDNGYLDNDHGDDCNRSGERDCCKVQRHLARVLNDANAPGSAARASEDEELTYEGAT